MLGHFCAMQLSGTLYVEYNDLYGILRSLWNQELCPRNYQKKITQRRLIVATYFEGKEEKRRLGCDVCFLCVEKTN